MPLLIVEEATASAIWDQLRDRLLEAREVAPRGIQTRELLGVVLRLEDMTQNVIVNTGRDLNYRFMVAEWLWIAFGRRDVETIAQYNKNISEFSDDAINFAGAYGPRIQDQWVYVVDTLVKDPMSRQAVMTIWERRPMRSKDIPCTVALQFLVRDGQLNCIVTMRSSDVWLGLPYDIFNFSMIAQLVAVQVGARPGFLQMTLGSSHVYEQNIHRLFETSAYKSYTVQSPILPSTLPKVMEFFLCSPGREDLGRIIGWEEELVELNRSVVWSAYALVLKQATKIRALEVLKNLEEAVYGPNPSRARH